MPASSTYLFLHISANLRWPQITLPKSLYRNNCLWAEVTNRVNEPLRVWKVWGFSLVGLFFTLVSSLVLHKMSWWITFFNRFMNLCYIQYTNYSTQILPQQSLLVAARLRIYFHNRFPVSALFKHNFNFFRHSKGELQLLITVRYEG